MRVALGVLGRGAHPLLNELFATLPRTSLPVAVTEGRDQQLRVVEPGGLRRRQPGAPPTLASREVVSGRPGAGATAVVDPEHTPQSALRAPARRQGQEGGLGVVLAQDDGLTASGVGNSRGPWQRRGRPGLSDAAGGNPAPAAMLPTYRVPPAVRDRSALVSGPTGGLGRRVTELRGVAGCSDRRE